VGLTHRVRASLATTTYKAFKVNPHAFKQNFLSDPSVYPLIGIVGFTLIFATAMGIRTLAVYKDVRIDPHKRSSILQTWGTEETHYLVGRMVDWNSWQKNMPEGLGIDHQKWLLQKKLT